VLGRNLPDWRLKHVCPACYKLKNEEPLLFKMLYTIDGNDSLRRILRRSSSGDDDESLGPSCEHQNSRQVPGDHYLSRDYVDKWAAGVLQEMIGVNPDAVGGLIDQKHPNHLIDRPLWQVDEDYNPCANRWKNMKDDITKKMWAIFDKTGIFLALCHHGFSLVIADMVQSGELYVSFVLLFLLLMHAYSAKYPLACVEKLLDAFGDDIGGGFDIGCKFKTTLNNSPLALVHVNFAIHALLVPSMAMHTIVCANFHISQLMSRVLGLRTWKDVNGHS